MLRPAKHAHPDQTVIGVAAILLKRLSIRKVESFDGLEKLAGDQVIGGRLLLIPALDFLYLLGVIEYHSKNDTFEYVGRR